MASRLEKNKNIKILKGKEINEIKKYPKKNEVILERYKYECEFLFDSRPSLVKKKEGLFQHFAGYEVTFYKNVLNNKQVTFMDFQSFTNGINFMYIYHFLQKKLYLNQHIFQKDFSRLKYKNNITGI